jgi:PAS domain S-box-containing protein
MELRKCGSLLLLLALGLLTSAPAVGEQSPLTVGVYDNAPKLFVTQGGEASGFFPDILAALSAGVGRDIIYRGCVWDECLSLLERGELDVMPDVAFSEARAERFRFGETPALYSWSYLYIPPGSVLGSLADLDRRRVAVLNGSIQAAKLAEYAQENGWTIDYVLTGSHEASFAAVLSGAADIAVVNHLFGESREAGSGLLRAQFVFSTSALYFAFSPSVPKSVIASFDAGLVQLKTDPNSPYFEAYEEWFAPRDSIQVPDWLIAAASFLAVIGTAAVVFVLVLRRRVREATGALRTSSDRLAEAQRLARIGNFSWTFGQPTVAWSDGMRTLLGYEEGYEPSIHEIADTVHHPDDNDRVMDWIRQGIDDGAEALGPEIYRLIRKSGEVIWVEANLKLERSASKGIVVFGTCQDITARVELERDLVEAKARAEQAAKAKSVFLASLSHEFRTPLNAIIGFSEILKMSGGPQLTEKQHEQLTDIHTAAHQLDDLVRDVLELTHAEQMDFRIASEAVCLQEVLSEALAHVRFLAMRHDVDLVDMTAQSEKVQCFADPARARQVLVNLLSNAVKYNRRGGCVTIDFGETGPDKVRLRVADTGLGIPKDQQVAIFNIFSRVQGQPLLAGEGTGVGLTIAKSLVERMGGEIGVESVVGEGSTFWCDFVRV